MANTHKVHWKVRRHQLQPLSIGLSVDSFSLSDSFVISTTGNVRLGLHVTSDELAIWQDRAVNGPYKTAGDESTYSPGDWDRMVSQAATFATDPLQELWQGQTAAGAWAPDGHSCTYTAGDGQIVGCVPQNGQGQLAAAAAFITLVQPQNYNYSSQVRQLLLAQIAEPGTDFTDTNKWPNSMLGDGWSGGISVMFTRLAYAYDYCRIAFPGTFSAQDREDIEAWFSDAAFYWARNVDFLIRTAFPNRNTQFDTSVDVAGIYPTDIRGNSPGTPGAGAGITHYDCTLGQRGHLAGGWTDLHNNRSTVQVRFGVVGSMLRSTPSSNDLQSQRWAKMWFKEWLTYSVFDDNMINDYFRWEDTPQNGWQYSGNAIGTMATVADLFARAGDTSLYDFETSAGSEWVSNPSGYNGDTVGGPKSLLGVIQRHASFVNQRSTGVPGWVGSESDHCGGDISSYLIQPVDDINFGIGSPWARIDDTRYPHANIYYQDNNVKLAYTRQLSGAPAYPQFPSTNGNANAWTGPWWEFCGVLFMFGQMEGVVNPYP